MSQVELWLNRALITSIFFSLTTENIMKHSISAVWNIRISQLPNTDRYLTGRWISYSK